MLALRKWLAPRRPRRTLPLMTSPTWHPVSMRASAAIPSLWSVFGFGGLVVSTVAAVFAFVFFVFFRLAVGTEVWVVICGNEIKTCKKSFIFSGKIVASNMCIDGICRVSSILFMSVRVRFNLLFPL